MSTKIKTPENIYLINTGESLVWCDTPKPSPSVNSADVTEYVRHDIHAQALTDLLKLERAEADRQQAAERDYMDQKNLPGHPEYAAWRATFQSSEQAAKSAFAEVQALKGYIEVKNGN